MRFRLLPIALVLLALTVLAAAPASARHRDRDRDRRFDDRRTRVIVVEQHRDFRHHRPHGWNHGRKVGWRGCDLPPGLAKKYGCHSSFRDRRVNRRVNQRPVVIIPLPFVRF